jgi:hypothetical protein
LFHFDVAARASSAILALMSMAGAALVTRARIARHVFLRLTAMDVCCGPPCFSTLSS